MDMAVNMTSDSIQLSGYKFVEKLYDGSRTIVYRAIREIDSQSVIIKILRHQYPTFKELLQLRNQYTISQNLDIPGIIHSYSLEPYQNSYALILEDSSGIALNQYIKTHTLSLKEILKVALSLSEILKDLYNNKIIHKDIKPANILLVPNTDRVKLIDFSISTLLSKETQEIQSLNTLEGTLAYLSPEQTGRMNRGVDYRTDFYSLGVTLFELMTGELPFQSNDPMELVYSHIAQTPPSVCEVNPNIPEGVGQIVSKLMAKNAEDRYQSALGLKFDLKVCLSQLDTIGTIAPFPLGQRDVCDRFLIPEKLYGRQQEVKTLLDAFDRISQGNTELILVAGFSGIGKTAVVHEVHKPIVSHRGYFVQGKFDQFNRNIPFSGFVQALRSLMRQLITEDDRQLAQWKRQILTAVGENGQVLIEVIPELEYIIGPQPPAAELSGIATQNRFHLLFQKFIQVFTTPDHPLVIFLDDLQWADSASLKLMQVLMEESQQGYLLLIGAYRDNEVFPTHPLMLALEDILTARATLHTITLKPLSLASLNQLIADTLACTDRLAQPLTDLVHNKTKGNPFFATQFLKALHQEELIRFDRQLGYWECDIIKVWEAALTDDVVEFMVQQLQKLPTETQAVLQLAACMGNQFDLATLAVVWDRSETAVATALWPGLQEGLILPQSEVYKFYLQSENVLRSAEFPETAGYKFLHDRVQQAAYSLIPADRKQETHLRIGQRLLANTPETDRETTIFEIVNQLNLGCALISEPQQRLQLAQLNLMAGHRAKLSTAYGPATNYFQMGIELLEANSWTYQYQLTLELYEAVAESEYLNTNFESSKKSIDLILDRARTTLDKVKSYEIQIQSYTAQNRFIEAIEMGRKALNLLDVDLPEDGDRETIFAESKAIQSLWGDRSISDLATLPELRDLERQFALRILSGLFAPVYIARPTLLPLKIFTMVKICIQHGNSPQAAIAYSLYGLLLCGMGQIETGYQFGQLAVTLLNQFQAKELKSRVYLTFSLFIKHWKDPFKSTLKLFREGLEAGLETGNLEYVGYCANCYCQFLFWAGEHLELIESESLKYGNLLQSIKQEVSFIWNSIWRQTVLNLQGSLQKATLLKGIAFNEEQDLPSLIQDRNINGICYVYLAKTLLFYWFGQFPDALEASHCFEEYEAGATGLAIVPLRNFYQSLTLLALCSKVEEPQKSAYFKKVLENQEMMQKWAEFAPANYLHKYNLVEAERHRVLKYNLEALNLYDLAISGAQEYGYVQDAALANELTAKFYLDWGKDKVAQAYMQEAYYGYARWGASAKVEHLETSYPQLLQKIFDPETLNLQTFNSLKTLTLGNLASHHATSTVTSSSSSTTSATIFDIATLLKISQSVSSEIKLEYLLTSLMNIAIDHAGATQGILILHNQGSWYEAVRYQKGESCNFTNTPLEEIAHLPLRVVNYVISTQEAVIINDVEAVSNFAGDPFWQIEPVKCLLCIPILNQGKLVAILALKNHLTANSFTSDRIELLNFLCIQAAISLENARLYEAAEQKSAQLQASLNELQESEARFKLLFEQSTDAILLIEIDKLIACNSTCLTLFGYDEIDVFLNKHPGDISPEFQPDGQLSFVKANQLIATAFEVGSNQFEWVHQRADGETFWADIVLTVIPYKNKSIIHAVIRDISDRKRAEEEIRRSEAMLREKTLALEQTLKNLQQAQLQIVQNEKMSALGNLVAGVAHEINNPVGFLAGNIQPALEYVRDLLGLVGLYQEKFPNPGSEIEEEVEAIDLEYLREDLPKLIGSMEEGVNRIRNISTSLRTFSRADKDYKVPFNIHDGLDSTLLILKHRLKANESRPAIAIVRNYGNLPCINCFPGQINQVFMNILSNAIDALEEMDEGRSFSEIQANPNYITIQTATLEPNQIAITIADNGIGMTAEVQQRIFDHLFTTKAVGKGTGLGLAIAYQIVVENHGGTLGVDSTYREGTQFTIALPL